MFRNTTTLIFFILLPFLCKSQNRIIDSLLSTLKTQKQDTLKVGVLNDLAWEYTRIDVDKAIIYADKAKVLSNELFFENGYIISQVRKGTALIYKRKLKESESIFIDVLKLEEGRQYLYGIARAHNQLAKISSLQENFEKALIHYKKALEKFKDINNKRQEASAYNNIAVAYKKMNRYALAMDNYMRSLNIRKILNDDNAVAYSYSNIGALYIEMKQFSKAIEYLNKSKRILMENKRWYGLSKVYTNLGVVLFEKGQEIEALASYKKALTINEDLGFTNKNINIYNNLGTLYYEKDELVKALHYYKESVVLQEKYDIKENKAITYYNLGNIEFKNESYNKAIEYYNTALAIAKQSKNSTALIDIKSALMLSYSEIEDYEKALSYNSEYIKLKDSIQDGTIKALTINFEYAEEQASIDLLAKDNMLMQTKLEKTQMLNIGVITGLFLLILLLLAIIRGNRQQRKANQSIIERQKVEELLKNQELKSINAMIEGQEGERQRIAKDLHDRLGSMLSTVKMHFKSVEESLENFKVSNIKQYERANELLDNACDEVRKISHNIASGVLIKFGLVAALEDLKEILEDTNKINVEFIAHGLDNRLDNDVEITIYRTIQELISNILKYAQAKNITIQLINHENNLNVLVEDDGIGFNINTEENWGMGLKNVRSRVSSLDGDINIDSTINKGTTVSIDIPLNDI